MFTRKRSPQDFAEEIKAHLALEADELQSEGLSEDEARWKAYREFGNVRAAKERFHLRGRWIGFDKFLHRRTNIAQRRARLDHIDSRLERGLRRLQKPLRLLVDLLADRNGNR